MLIYLRYLSFKTILARKRQNGQIGRNGSMCKIKHCVVSVFILLDYVMAILSISASISWLFNPGLGADINTFNSIIEYVLFIYSAIPFGYNLYRQKVISKKSFVLEEKCYHRHKAFYNFTWFSRLQTTWN